MQEEIGVWKLKLLSREWIKERLQEDVGGADRDMIEEFGNQRFHHGRQTSAAQINVCSGRLEVVIRGWDICI